MLRPLVASTLVLLILTAAAPALAQGPDGDDETGSDPAPAESCVLHGRVTDETDEPLAGARVSVQPGDVKTVSDADGRYCFAELAPAAYQVVAEYGGFSQLGVVDVTVEGGSWSLDLMVKANIREQVVVTATRTRKGLDEVAVRTQLITKDFMDATGARTLADAVEYTTGLRVESNCQNCNFSQIRLLGLEGPYTEILVDGQPVISSLAQVYGIEQIPARMIDRIEVVKGGGSALYGPGAVGGVVNVIPREAARSGGGVSGSVDMMGGQASVLGNGSYDWVSAGGRTVLTTFGQLDRVRAHDVDGDGFTEVSQRDLGAFGLRFGQRLLDDDARLAVDLNRIHEYRRGGDRLDLPPDQAFVAEQLDSTRYGVGASWLHAPNNGAFDYTVTASMSHMTRDSYYGTFMDPNAFGDTRSVLGVADAQLNHYLGGGHVLSWGGQLSAESIADNQPAYGRFIDESSRNLGLFVQHDWAFASGFQVLLGARADKHTAIDRVIVSPRAALMYSPMENLDFRASVATGFRAPEVFDEDLHLSAAGGSPHLIFLSPELREERSHNLMLGGEWKPTLGPGQGLLEVNGFYTRLADLFHNIEHDDPATGAFEFLKVNLGGARVYGVETNVGWGIGEELILQGGVVVQRARFDEPDPDWGSRAFFRTPDVYGNFSATWNNGIADLFVGALYTGPMKAPHYAGFIAEDRLETTPSFVTLDLYVSRTVRWSGRPVVITLGARNLTDAYQGDLDRGPLRDASYVYGPRFPRTLKLGFRWEI